MHELIKMVPVSDYAKTIIRYVYIIVPLLTYELNENWAKNTKNTNIVHVSSEIWNARSVYDKVSIVTKLCEAYM